MLAQRVAPSRKLCASLAALATGILVPSVAAAMEAHESGRNVDVVVAADGKATFTETVALDVVYGPLERLTFAGAPDTTATVTVQRRADVTPKTAPNALPDLSDAATVTRTVGRDGEPRFVVRFVKKGLPRGLYDVVLVWSTDVSRAIRRNGSRTTLALSGLVHEQSVDDAHFTVHTPDFGAAPTLGSDDGFSARAQVSPDVQGGYRIELGRAHLARSERFVAPIVFGNGAFAAVRPSESAANTDSSDDAAHTDANAEERFENAFSDPALRRAETNAFSDPALRAETNAAPVATSETRGFASGRALFAFVLPLAFAALLFGKLRRHAWRGALIAGLGYAAALVAFLFERDAVAVGLLAVALLPLVAASVRGARAKNRGIGEWLAVVAEEVRGRVGANAWLDPSSTFSRGAFVALALGTAALVVALFARDARLAAAVATFATPFFIALRALRRDRFAPEERHSELLIAARAKLSASTTGLRATLLARFPLGSESWDDLRVLVTARDTLPGLRSIEAGLLRDENDEPAPLADIHVRVFNGSEAHDRLLARYGASGFAPGRIPEERVLRLRVARPGADALAETLATVAHALVERRARRSTAPSPEKYRTPRSAIPATLGSTFEASTDRRRVRSRTSSGIASARTKRSGTAQFDEITAL